MDNAGRYLAIAVGRMGDWMSFDAYDIYLLDTATKTGTPSKLALGGSADIEGVGGERFVRMAIHGDTLVVEREERYMHWDGVIEQRPAKLIGFDLGKGERCTALGALAEPPIRAADTGAVRMVAGESQPAFIPLTAALARTHGHRPTGVIGVVALHGIEIVEYEVHDGANVQPYIHLRIAGTDENSSICVATELGTTGGSRIESYTTTIVYVARAGRTLCCIPLGAPLPVRPSAFHRRDQLIS